MKHYILFITLIACCIVFSGCEYDNYDEPNSMLSGKVVYEGMPVGVRSNGIELELWQDGYAKKLSIPVYVAHDGSYSVVLFDGQYKLVRKAGAPWENQLNDTIIVNVNKNTVVDVPVRPYFIIRDEKFQKEQGNIVAKFTIDKIVGSASIESVRLYLGKAILTDNNKNELVVSANLSDITIGQEATITATIPANLAKEEYLFVRVGVRSKSSNEFYYTQVRKVELK